MFSALFRPPLVWFAAAEAALIVILGAVTWHVWIERTAPPAPVAVGPAAVAPPGSGPASVPGLSAGQPASSPSARAPDPQVGPTPGIRTDPEFLSRQLMELNRVESTFEDLEWRVTRAIADAIQRYVEGVVLPSIERSEQGRR